MPTIIRRTGKAGQLRLRARVRRCAMGVWLTTSQQSFHKHTYVGRPSLKNASPY
jgi:hypothetical protein